MSFSDPWVAMSFSDPPTDPSAPPYPPPAPPAWTPRAKGKWMSRSQFLAWATSQRFKESPEFKKWCIGQQMIGRLSHVQAEAPQSSNHYPRTPSPDLVAGRVSPDPSHPRTHLQTILPRPYPWSLPPDIIPRHYPRTLFPDVYPRTISPATIPRPLSLVLIPGFINM
jgi:hypothetical protein